MSGFSPEWLALREQADARARNRGVADAVTARFQLRDSIVVTDLGSGTGSNLRFTAPLLPKTQLWTLVDQDEQLNLEARRMLSNWATKSKTQDETLHLEKDSMKIAVKFKTSDLATGLEAAISPDTNLVTASAFFDLTSLDFMRRLTRLSAERKACVYAALTYNGIQRWAPPRPTDNQMSSAFHRHMMCDKGFGPATGPTAASDLADQFNINGFYMVDGDSPWALERSDRMLIEELARGYAMAVSETGAVNDKTITDWVNLQRTGAIVGHTDIFAVPSERLTF